MEWTEGNSGLGLGAAYYGSFARSLGKSDFIYTLKQWSENSPFFVFDCSPAGNSSSCDTFTSSPSEPAVMMIHVKFKKPLDQVVILRCVVEYRCSFVISENGLTGFKY